MLTMKPPEIFTVVGNTSIVSYTENFNIIYEFYI